MSDKSFSVDRARAVSEILDGEAIVINMETGCYYSLANTAAAVWRLLLDNEGVSAATIARALAPAYDAPEDEVRSGVASLLADLEAEKLVATGAAPPRALSIAAPSAKQAFTRPVLERYTDMQNFLLVDPIHEVTEKGWPQVQ